MKLRRLRLTQFKRFREPLTLDGFVDGLNLFAAPNEAGKSTIVEAIRAAFFERHRSSSVEHLRPWDDPGATPTVEVDFDIGTRHYRLAKTFLGRKRCSLQIDGKPPLDGTDAEDHLAQLLGYTFASKGASAPQHMGIPGLLWIRQGSAHELADAVGHASDHLRQVLGESLGELTSSGGDALMATVESARNELLTPSTGKPRGDYAGALARKTALEETLSRLDREILGYQNAVDRLATLRHQHQRDDNDRPWAAIRQQHEAAHARLQAAQSLAARQQTAQASVLQSRAQVAALRSQVDAYLRDESALASRKQQVQSMIAAEAAAQGALEASQRRQRDATMAEAEAHRQWERVQAAGRREDLEAAARQLEGALSGLDETLRRAREEREWLIRLQAECEALAISADDLKTLKQLTESLREAGIRLEAAATTLRFDILDGRALRIGTETISGQVRRTLVATTEIDIEGIGRITVVPGAADLESLSARRERESVALATLLSQLGVSHAADAEERARQSAQRRQEAKASRQLLDALAPQGVEALDSERAAGGARLAELRGALDALPAVEADESELPSRASVEAEVARAKASLAATTTAVTEARVAAAKAQSDLSAAEQEYTAAEVTANDPQRAQRLGNAQRSLTDARADEAAAQQRVEALVAELADTDLDLLKQDVERLQRSAQQQEQAHAQRRDDITRLQVELETKGALGLEEQRAETQQAFAAAERRAAELGRRAVALDYLLGLFHEKRAVLARQLRAPLQKHLDRALQILFPGAHIDIADDLSPGQITRDGARGSETGGFDQLSMGTREQMGIIARLAYADLLQEAGKPTLLILDDALVNTDEARLGRMKRVLYDAAQRHQLLIFTCHPAAWRDLGVVARSIDA